MKSEKQKRLSQPAVSEQMKAWSAALASEVGDWPQVSIRSFFGFTALYRGDKMFAALPRTRGLESANSLAFKLKTSASVNAALEDPRIRSWSGEMKEARWFTFELSSGADIHHALDWLGRAYAAAGRNNKSK